MDVAIVLGAKGVNATGLIRSLGREGINVVYASVYSRIESKYTSKYLKLPTEKIKWIDILIRYSLESKNIITIFPTDDDTAFWIDENYELLQKHFVVPHANGKMKTLADKSIMNTMAQKAGLNVPDFTKLLLSDSVRENKYPIILKPYAGYAGDKGSISICHNDNDYLNAIDRLKKRGYSEILLQQLLEDSEQEEIGLMGMVLDNGEVVIPGIIHKIRSYPTGKGSTSYARFSPEMSEIDVEKIKHFVTMTGYVGIFDIEMIKAYGQYWFIEINYRNGQYGYTPTAAGYNLPVNWLNGMKSKKIQKCDNLSEIYYMNERDDYRHVKNGVLSRGEWIKQFSMTTAYGMYCPGDQRPFIRQYVKIPDRVAIKCAKWKSYIKELFIKEEWNVAIRKREEKLLWEEFANDKKFNVLPNTLRYWAADPFLISNEDKDYLFFEMFDRFKGKGLIGYREICNDNIGKMKIAYEAEHHLSFPFVFKHDNDYYMMPEYSEGKELFLMKAIRFPDKWEKVESWMKGKRVVDSVLLNHEGKTYLVTQELKNGYSSDELLIYVKEGEEWIPHRMNPVVKNLSNSRLAGRIFERESHLIRVAQDCEFGYGTKIHFNNILTLSEIEFVEAKLKTVEIKNISTDARCRYRGIHTYDFNEQYEVIDLKNPNHIKIGNIINLVWKVLMKLKKVG